MHELSLAQDVLKKVREKAQEEGFDRVTHVKVAVGQTLVSDQEELKELFSMISIGTIAESAKLEIEIIPLRASCESCGSNVDMKTFRLDCPRCGSSNFQIVSGKEIEIKEIK